MSTFQRITCLFFFLLFCVLSHASDNVESQLSKTRTAMQIAVEANAELLAPANFKKGRELLETAELKFKQNKKPQIVLKQLNHSLTAFSQSINIASSAQEKFSATLKAKSDALAAEANVHSIIEWQKADRAFESAIKKLEAGNTDAGEKKASNAETLFRLAELNAIKTNYLTETKRLIATADKEKVKKHAPITLQNARQLLNQAEKELNENRYDTDKARSLARNAKVQAGHAIYLTKDFKAIRDNELTLEQYALQSEQPLLKVSNALDLSVNLDKGMGKPTQQVIEAINALRADAIELQVLQQEMIELVAENQQLNERLGVQSSRLRKQDAIKQKIALVEAMFALNEARVYRQSGNILIRMVGLNFNSGQSVIQSENFNLLGKVIKALALFPKATLTVEGHTDSFGGDDINLALSQARADAVVEYLKANIDTSTLAFINSLGYGESRPVANNESTEGRKKNRRIDLVIKQAF